MVIAVAVGQVTSLCCQFGLLSEEAVSAPSWERHGVTGSDMYLVPGT